MRMLVASLLFVTLLIPFTLFSEDNGLDNVPAYPRTGDYRKGVSSGDLVTMGPKPPASNTCKCWTCPWDQRIYCKMPDSHPDCKWLLFPCEGPRPEECCDE